MNRVRLVFLVPLVLLGWTVLSVLLGVTVGKVIKEHLDPPDPPDPPDRSERLGPWGQWGHPEWDQWASPDPWGREANPVHPVRRRKD